MAVRRLNTAILLSTNSFEEFYGRGLGLSRSGYLEGYRNDWSWDWCRMLRRQGVDASIYVATVDRGERVLTSDGYTVRFLPLGRLFSPWTRFPVLSRTPPGRYVSQVANALAMLSPLKRALVEDGIDVLCVQEYWTGRFDVLTRAGGPPVVAIDQGVPDRRELKLFKRRAFARCAGVVVQTEHERLKVAQHGGDARRIPNAVDSAFYRPLEPRRSAEPVILWVGRLADDHKRISDLIRAFARLPVTWRLRIAGVGPDQGMLAALADELGVGGRVEFLGFVADSDALRSLYQAAGVFAIPSAFEGLPMVLLEAMSCGAAVVGSDIPAIAEVIGDHAGITVPVRSPERLASAISEAFERRAELGSAARAEVLQTYDQAVVGARLAELLVAASVVSGPGSGAQRRVRDPVNSA